MTRVRVSEEAREFLRNEARYLKTHSSVAAQRFLARVAEAKRKLSDFPLMGPPDEHALVPQARRLVVGDYVMTYDVVGDLVAITSIRHGQMAPAQPDLDDDLDFET